MNNFEVNVGHVGVNVDLADMKSNDSNNSLFGVTSFDSDVVDDLIENVTIIVVKDKGQ
jgi:hypothetical protein